MFDDYANFRGETRAEDEFFANKSLAVQKIPVPLTPSFVAKE